MAISDRRLRTTESPLISQWTYLVNLVNSFSHPGVSAVNAMDLDLRLEVSGGGGSSGFGGGRGGFLG